MKIERKDGKANFSLWLSLILGKWQMTKLANPFIVAVFAVISNLLSACFLACLTQRLMMSEAKDLV